MAIVTIGTTDYPSFETVDEADLYLGGDAGRATAWALRNADTKGRGLVTATRMLLALRWCGDPPTVDAPPQVVKDVTAMLAADGLTKPSIFSNPSGAIPQGIKTAKAGSAQVEFFGPAAATLVVTNPIPTDLWNMLVAAGLVGCDDDTGMNDGPFVSGIDDGRCRDRLWVDPWLDPSLNGWPY